MLDAIYYPDTNTGYWFGDSDSYSSYGMIAKVVQQRGMSWSGVPGDQGTVSAGTMTSQKSYNFPLTTANDAGRTAGTGLTDAPTYTKRTESFAGMNTGQVDTLYDVTKTTGDEIIKVTLPDSTVNQQTSHVGGSFDGMYYLGEIYASSTAQQPLSKTLTTLQAGDYGTSRPSKIEITDELQNTSTTTLDYAPGGYNQMVTQKEFGFSASQVYRQTNNTYENNAAYTGRHIFNLLRSTEVVDGSGTRLARTDYEYDDNAVVNGTANPNLVAATGVIMHKDTSDPFTTNTHQENGACLAWDPSVSEPLCDYEGEEVWIGNAGGYFANCSCTQYDEFTVSNYDPNSIFRGNVTKTTVYADAANPAGPAGAVFYDFTYDIAGNQRTATTDCCQQMSFDYADGFGDNTARNTYAYPTAHTKGSSDPNSSLRMTESAKYDFNTGALVSSTDFNGRTTTYAYDAASRPTLTTMPTGGKVTNDYDDANLTATQTVQLSDNTVVSKSASVWNGRGQAVLSKYLAGATNWNAVSVQYDEMGRKWKTSLPYDLAAGSSQWAVFSYDELSRVKQVTAPDGSTSKTFYNESARPDSASATAGQTVRSQDAWGRERWARTDAFGRLVEVVEPKPSGNGGVLAVENPPTSLQTSYSHDELDRLILVTQGGQTRSFKYDSLGRLTRQKLAEQTATLSENGEYVQPGNPEPKLWSEAFWYDDRSNITQRTDARGVKTNFSYLLSGNPDPLNRLQGISYDTSTADTSYTINTTAPVALEYMITGDQTRVKKVTTSGVATEENAFDTEGRISDYTLTLTSRSSYPMTTSYSYDTANRLSQITYPAQYGVAATPRKIVSPFYDQASRLTQLSVGGQTQLNEVSYNAFGQVTSLKTGAATGNPDVEQYSYDSQTGLLTNQKVIHTNPSATLLDLSYEYNRGNSNGSLNGKTGQLTHIVNNVDHNKDRVYEFDALGRLTKAKGGAAAGATGVVADWTQDYGFDRFGNKTGVTATGITADSAAVPSDGLASLGYDAASNRINSSGWEYDLAGNLVRGQNAGGVWQRFEYDAAGRLVKVKDDSGNVLETYTYAADRSRLVCDTGAARTYYAWGGSAVIQEYTEGFRNPTSPAYSKAYVYAGGRLLSTATPNRSGETVEFHHPDRLGTKLVTNPSAGTSFEQSTLPFGTYLSAETYGTNTTNQKFTSYDRSPSTGLDYAVNRTYSQGQGTFTQVDPIGMAASSADPQSLNLFAYTQNDPVNFVDPSGLDDEIYYVVTWAPGNWWDALWSLYLGGRDNRVIAPGQPPSDGGGGGGGGEQPTVQGGNYFTPDCLDRAFKVNRNSNSEHALNRLNAVFAILLKAAGADFSVAQAAYALATAEVETTYFTQLRESGTELYFNKFYNGKNGNIPDTDDGYIYRGGGYSQLQGRGNYAKFGYEDNPDEVTRPLVAAGILIQGLQNGFTKYGGLGNFVNAAKQDFFNARRTVNAAGLKAGEVARFARKYNNALLKCNRSS